MRTLFAGAGATGGFFGGRLAQAGKDVTFLVRERRAAQLAADGLRIRRPAGDVDRIAVRSVTESSVDGPYELVVLAVKGFALDSVVATLGPAVGSDTVIVPLLNGMRHIEVMNAAFGAEHVFGGACFIASQLTADGTIEQLTDLQGIAYGPLDGPDPRLDAVHDALSGGGFRSDPSLTIRQDMWEKWSLLAALGAACCLLRGSVPEMMAGPAGRATAEAIAAEVIAVATAAGHPPRSTALITAGLDARGVPPTSSMFRDLTQDLPVESEQLLGDLLHRGRELGVATPLVAAAFASLEIYENRRALT